MPFFIFVIVVSSGKFVMYEIDALWAGLLGGFIGSFIVFAVLYFNFYFIDTRVILTITTPI